MECIVLIEMACDMNHVKAEKTSSSQINSHYTAMHHILYYNDQIKPEFHRKKTILLKPGLQTALDLCTKV